MASKKQQGTDWAWVCRLQFDSMGVARWFPHYNVSSPTEGKRSLRAVELLGMGGQWRVEPPGHDRAADIIEQDESAAAGICPRCQAKPKHARSGRSQGYSAFKCSKCGHTWRLRGTRKPGYRADGPVEGSGGKKGTSGRKKKKKGKKSAPQKAD